MRIATFRSHRSTELELIDLSPETPVKAVEFLAGAAGLPRGRIKDAMTKGAVWLTQGKRQRRLRRATTLLQPGDRISLYYDEQILATVPASPDAVEIAHEWSVWIKPAGLVCGGTRFGDHCAINRIVERQLDRPTFLVHRLDQFVCGLILLAHSKSAAAALSKQFETRETLKVYRAVVHGRLEADHEVTEPVEGKPSRSLVRTVVARDDFSEVEIEIETGRKHQIRRHLQWLGHPVVGDRLYGSDSPEDLKLAAIRLGFTDPSSGETKHFELPGQLYPQPASAGEVNQDTGSNG